MKTAEPSEVFKRALDQAREIDKAKIKKLRKRLKELETAKWENQSSTMEP
jgi:hypothetical protein